MRTGVEHDAEARGCHDYVLEVIQHQKHPLHANGRQHAIDQRLNTHIPQSETRRHGVNHQQLVGDGREVDEHDAIGERLCGLGGGSDGQARLPYSARSSQREQAMGRVQKQGCHGGDVAFPTNQRRQWPGEGQDTTLYRASGNHERRRFILSRMSLEFGHITSIKASGWTADPAWRGGSPMSIAGANRPCRSPESLCSPAGDCPSGEARAIRIRSHPFPATLSRRAQECESGRQTPPRGLGHRRKPTRQWVPCCTRLPWRPSRHAERASPSSTRGGHHIDQAGPSVKGGYSSVTSRNA